MLTIYNSLVANYYHDRNRQKSYNFRRKLRRTLLVLLILLLFAFVIAGVYFWQNTQSNKGPVVIKPPTKSYYAGAPKRLIQTDRFSFESPSNWQLSNEESLGTSKYVYFTHSLSNDLIEFELDILFDRSLDGQPVNYVMPVTVTKENKLLAGPLSERCGDQLVAQKGNSAPGVLAMQFQNAHYICAVTGSGEKAAVAVIGSSYDLPLRGSNGQLTYVNISFKNSSSSSFGSELTQIVNSFKLK